MEDFAQVVHDSIRMVSFPTSRSQGELNASPKITDKIHLLDCDHLTET